MIIQIAMFLFISFTVVNEQAEYPVPPKTNKMLFYIQRNHNKNTIIYDANYDKNGNLVRDNPVNVYWIRYEENGQKMKLRALEKWMVFGVSAKFLKNNNEYLVHLSASDKISLWLKQIEPYKAEIHTEVKGEMIKLDHIYAQLSESGWLPKPIYAEFFGTKLSDGKAFYKKVDPKYIK